MDKRDLTVLGEGAPVSPATLTTFLENVQRFIFLQFNARCNVLIRAFGEEKGIEYAERFDKYGIWFFMHKLEDAERPVFYQLVFDLPKPTV